MAARRARDGSEPGENPGLGETLEQQRLVERQIAELERRLATARVVRAAADGTADLGAMSSCEWTAPRASTSWWRARGRPICPIRARP
jgi:hypothetical protein